MNGERRRRAHPGVGTQFATALRREHPLRRCYLERVDRVRDILRHGVCGVAHHFEIAAAGELPCPAGAPRLRNTRQDLAACRIDELETHLRRGRTGTEPAKVTSP